VRQDSSPVLHLLYQYESQHERECDVNDRQAERRPDSSGVQLWWRHPPEPARLLRNGPVGAARTLSV